MGGWEGGGGEGGRVGGWEGGRVGGGRVGGWEGGRVGGWGGGGKVTSHLVVPVVEEHREVVLFHRISQLHFSIHPVYQFRGLCLGLYNTSNS